jgi:hypothetical protein
MANIDDFPELYQDGATSPCWSCNCDMSSAPYAEILQWNSRKRMIKKGERHQTFPCRKGRYFSQDQTVPFDIFYISKKNGKFRRIFSVYKEEKNELRGLLPALEEILLKNDQDKINYAFVKNRNCIEHAMQHIGYEYTVSMDLENFFESVTVAHVKQYLSDYLIERCFISGAPQQGLPTSPIIANLAFLECDKKIIYALKNYRIDAKYTRYADDLVVSFDNKKDIGKVIFLIKSIVNDAKFKINKKKTKIQNIKNGRIIITGVGIDKKGVYPTRKTIKKIRAAIYNNNQACNKGLQEWAKCKLPKS